MENATYNKKGFLLPDSINSCAMYHAKILPGGEYYFRIHDCVQAIRLRGNLAEAGAKQEAIAKLQTLARAAWEFADYIERL